MVSACNRCHFFTSHPSFARLLSSVTPENLLIPLPSSQDFGQGLPSSVRRGIVLFKFPPAQPALPQLRPLLRGPPGPSFLEGSHATSQTRRLSGFSVDRSAYFFFSLSAVQEVLQGSSQDTQIFAFHQFAGRQTPTQAGFPLLSLPCQPCFSDYLLVILLFSAECSNDILTPRPKG